MSFGAGTQLDIGGVAFRIATPDEKWAAVIRELWRPFVISSQDVGIEIEIRVDDDHFVLSSSTSDPVTLEDPWLALLALRNLLDDEMLAATGAVDLHASLLVRDDEVLLLPGESGAGKTTLTMHLATRGWSFGGDDLCPLALDSSRVTAVPRPVGLRTLADLPDGLWKWPSWLATPAFAMLLPASVFPSVARGEYRPTRIGFVRFVPAAPTAVNTLSVAAATTRLASHIRPLTAEVVAGVRWLCGSVRSAEFIYGATEEGALALEQWAE